MNYYNDFDKNAVRWLRNLISAGLLPMGVVDDRPIQEVLASDLIGYTQCHFFAGIGGWPLALQLAGWPKDRPVWTGSCPCQPFSVAGTGGGNDDPRALWWAFRWLIMQCKPPVVFGEQVASKDGRGWLAGVRSDLEALGYEVGAADLCAAGVKAEGSVLLAGNNGIRQERVNLGPAHIRQRLYWVADTSHQRINGSGNGREGRQGEYPDCGGLGDSRFPGTGRDTGTASSPQEGGGGSRVADGLYCGDQPDTSSDVVGLGNAEWQRLEGFGASVRGKSGYGGSGEQTAPPGYADFTLIPCGDGKARRLEPGLVPLVDGLPKVLAYVCPECSLIIEKTDHDRIWAAPSAIPLRSEEMPGLRSDGEITQASCGQRPDQQRTGEYRNFMHYLPCDTSSERTSSFDVCDLWEDVFSQGSSEKSQMLLTRLCPRDGSEMRIEEMEYIRVSSIRGFGNAIVPTLAAEFIGAYIS